MSLLSCLGKGCRLAAIALLLSWLALQPTASAAPGAADLASYNPLRSNAVAETNDLRTVAAAPRQA
ncbi:MAG TPA: hypothetical protein VJL29_05300, partial [Thermoguttaceae bacterium]|nr:hypothetical protein [Thermoguttaceae bacterium]